MMYSSKLLNKNPSIVCLFAVIFSYCTYRTVPVSQQQFKAGEEYIYMADPTIFSDNGTYYLYGTGGTEYKEI